MFPDSHLATIIVIFLLSIADCNVLPVSAALHSITFSHPHAFATFVRDVFKPAYVG